MDSQYASRPKEFMQGVGGGKPYNTGNPSHFTARYGMRSMVPSLVVGVFRETPAEMMRLEAGDNGARRTLRLLSS